MEAINSKLTKMYKSSSYEKYIETFIFFVLKCSFSPYEKYNLNLLKCSFLHIKSITEAIEMFFSSYEKYRFKLTRMYSSLCMESLNFYVRYTYVSNLYSLATNYFTPL